MSLEKQAVPEGCPQRPATPAEGADLDSEADAVELEIEAPLWGLDRKQNPAESQGLES